ncbi:DUF3168 domain-containing protein [Siculibacillus lacustris]|uniref:DUF3168 domain-containing protein n=1 Tax=Siculibacillus lacustris TaxID=1549641 RepID=UPI001D188D89|nr:DUF3168 domain-containing protein [Siculibacillus lacustris]
MTTAAHALLTVILARLRADAGLAAPPLAGRVFDAPPRDAAFPHLVVDAITSRDRSGLDAPLDEHRLTLRILSRAGGRGEASGLAAAVERALLAPGLSLAGHRLVGLAREGLESRLLKDRTTAEVLLRFVALTEPLATDP